MTPKDAQGTPIKPGDVILVALLEGRRPVLAQRFVREVHPTYLWVQSTPEEPEDLRSLGRIKNFRNCIVVS